jgi:pimeloyl-ACP methyl ester carboxylesterase
MYMTRSRPIWAALAAIAVLSASLAVASSASAEVPVTQTSMPGFEAPGTPAKYNQVGVIKVGPPQASNVLVFEPGTSAGAGYFVPFAKWVVEHTKGWQVWSVERRQNLIEDQSELNKAKRGEATPEELYNYYLGWLEKPPGTINPHFEFVPDSTVGYARQWGMNVAVEDLHRVIDAAKQLHGSVVLAGHSLGGSIVTAYATWNFGEGKAGAVGLRGLVYDDGGSSPIPVSAKEAEKSLEKLSKKTPWLAFGGVPTPFLGILSALGSTLTVTDPKGEALLEKFSGLPESLKCRIPPFTGPFVKCTNEAGFGYSTSVGSSPPNLKAGQIHGGELEAAEVNGLHGWNGAGALTPVQRYAEMLSGTGLSSADGTEWYFPERLTIDTGAVADGNENPAQSVLDVHATQGSDLPQSLKIYAFATELGKQGVLTAAEILAKQSGIPSSNLTLINKENTYAHNDPAGAYPNNEFFNNLVPFLEGIAK